METIEMIHESVAVDSYSDGRCNEFYFPLQRGQ